jgi:predicted permease
MLRSIARLSAVDPGFNVERLLTVTISAGARSRPEATSLYQRMIDELAAVPGVVRVGAAGVLPVGPSSMTGSSLAIRSRPRLESEPALFTMFTGVTPGYFEALEAPPVEGRAITQLDVDQNRPVAWVNRAFARQFLDNRAIGEWINIADAAWLEIVGVVGDLRISGLRNDSQPMVYLPWSKKLLELNALFAVVRTAGEPSSVSTSLRAAVNRVDPSVPLTIRTMDEIVSAALAQTTFTVTLLSIAAAIGLLLGLVGLYGAISYIAAQRTREIGVRLALGANPAVVCMMVLRQGFIVALIGIAVGLTLAWPSTRLMSSMLFGVSAHDPATYAVVTILLMMVSMFATYIPARKASAVDPVQALRSD